MEATIAANHLNHLNILLTGEGLSDYFCHVVGMTDTELTLRTSRLDLATGVEIRRILDGEGIDSDINRFADGHRRVTVTIPL